MKDTRDDCIAILGGGNIGQAIAKGLVASKKYSSDQIIITKRQIDSLADYKKAGYVVQSDNISAIKKSKIVIVTVRPRQLDQLIHEIKSELKPKKHILVSVVTGVNIQELKAIINKDIYVVRAMPNIAVAICESMTCISGSKNSEDVLKQVKLLFNSVGKTIEIDEEYMIPATALCACGVAFFLRSIRAASQGGIEIGFHGEEALLMAAQTAKGAAGLLLNSSNNHPESEIDKVTTPRGCTISGLNEMEHHGFSSAMIKGIVVSAQKAAKLLDNNGD
jgi:pyrroline-5-carboxylate reductase